MYSFSFFWLGFATGYLVGSLVVFLLMSKRKDQS